ncbi:MAG: hypothetical protein LC754_18195 [Acidobacteria bacterium]|nr:hypothetical protein [Acidobacteriota bacterium]
MTMFPRTEHSFGIVVRKALAHTTVACCLFLVALASSALPAQAQTSGSPDLVVSQIYTRGGEPGATAPNDFIELFNRGTSTVNLAEYSLFVSTTGPGATAGFITTFVSSRGGVPLEPGQYRFIQVGGGFFNDHSNLGSVSGKIAVVKTKNFSMSLGCPLGQDAAVADYVAYGPVSCAEGGAPSNTTTASNTALVRKNEGCTDTDNNASDFSLGTPTPRDESTPRHICAQSPTPNSVQFEVDHTDVSEGQGSLEIFVTRAGDTSSPATVQYATVNGEQSFTTGPTSDVVDYTTALGTLRFAAGESRKSIHLLITDDVFFEGTDSLNIKLGSPQGVALGSPNTITINITDNDSANVQPNPINLSGFFAHQHYADFLSRDPDTSGLNFWTGEIEGCGADAACREVKRINVSAAFYLSIEFQQTGYLVYRFYKASYPDSTSRPRSFPTYREFWHDTQDIGRGVVIGAPGADALLESNKGLFATEFVTRPEFTLRYPQSMTPAQFVDALNTNAGGALSTSERDALVSRLQGGTETRATVLRKVAEDADFQSAEFNRAFVLMEYFGYLRRAPNGAPDADFTGYDFWLGKLNQFNGNFIQAEMVKAFITSDEYRHRFATQ